MENSSGEDTDTEYFDIVDPKELISQHFNNQKKNVQQAKTNELDRIISSLNREGTYNLKERIKTDQLKKNQCYRT